MLAVGAMVLTVGIGTWKLGEGTTSIGEHRSAPTQATTPVVSEPPIAVAPPPDAPVAHKASKPARHRTP
jgi:hypothetical protein